MKKVVDMIVEIRPVSKGESGGSTGIRVSLFDEFGYPRTKNEIIEIAYDRACTKIFNNSTAFWWSNSGLEGFGQVMCPCDTGGSNSITGTAAIYISDFTL